MICNDCVRYLFDITVPHLSETRLQFFYQGFTVITVVAKTKRRGVFLQCYEFLLRIIVWYPCFVVCVLFKMCWSLFSFFHGSSIAEFPYLQENVSRRTIVECCDHLLQECIITEPVLKSDIKLDAEYLLLCSWFQAHDKGFSGRWMACSSYLIYQIGSYFLMDQFWYIKYQIWCLIYQFWIK